ncbi:MAG: type II toxin-antitoxin system RelE/ParE family toxin [Desulfobacteraceae bacterium]|nr:type II toxin-antitoxin system RelE/ParE family toxin [Desulfobacteraceae bacterium]
MNQIKWHKKAIKQLRKIKDAKIRIKIHLAVDTLKNFPNCQNVKKLTNRDDYRLRVENWRVLFTADLRIVYIEEVKKRNEKTY